MECIELRGGLAVPVPVLLFALDLEDRGYVLIAADDSLRLRPGADGVRSPLTDEDRVQIQRFKAHLLALAIYEAPEIQSATDPQQARQKRNKAQRAKH